MYQSAAILQSYGVPAPDDPAFILRRSAEDWRRELSPAAFEVLFEAATEAPFANALCHEKRPGLYLCAAGGTPLFHSADKFDSGTGWPSFSQPLAPWLVEEVVDTGHGMVRTEVRCARSGGHLGHVFADGPPPSVLRYCMNSASLLFVPDGGTT